MIGIRLTGLNGEKLTAVFSGNISSTLPLDSTGFGTKIRQNIEGEGFDIFVRECPGEIVERFEAQLQLTPRS